MILPLLRGTEAAPTFWFPWNEKVGAASVPRKEVPIRGHRAQTVDAK